MTALAQADAVNQPGPIGWIVLGALVLVAVILAAEFVRESFRCTPQPIWDDVNTATSTELPDRVGEAIADCPPPDPDAAWADEFTWIARGVL